ncbi:MAG: hypothetical protein LUQ59_02655 [Methanothrix sp.]|nr:hypothetical protein [Methanothrix sp.]
MKKFICRNCGVVNEAEDATISDSGDWLDCDLPTGFEWTLPAGKITPIVGDPIYISGNGEHLSQSEYLDKYKIDPEIAYKLMRGKASSQTASQLVSSQNLKKASTVKNSSSKI